MPVSCFLCSSHVVLFHSVLYTWPSCSLIPWVFIISIFSLSLCINLCLLLSGPMMGGRTDQWSMNKTKDSSMPDSFLGHFTLFNLCIFFFQTWCSWDHSKSDFHLLSEWFLLFYLYLIIAFWKTIVGRHTTSHACLRSTSVKTYKMFNNVASWSCRTTRDFLHKIWPKRYIVT